MNRSGRHYSATESDIEAATRFLREAYDAAIFYDTFTDGRQYRSREGFAATAAQEKEQRIVATRMIRFGVSANIELFEIGTQALIAYGHRVFTSPMINRVSPAPRP